MANFKMDYSTKQKNKQTILFRADSSSTIGIGHIMRDLVLAQRDFKDDNIVFATQDFKGNINHKIVEAGYKIELLHSNDIEEFISVVQKYEADLVVIDHYQIDYKYEQTLKERVNVKILVFDDTYEKHYCDILLNHNLYADPKKYEGLVSKQCELRCGSKYTLLRNEFIIEKAKGRQNSNNPENLNVFIAMGGADHSNLNTKILDVLKNFPNIHAHVVTTMANQHLEELKKYIENKRDITLHINTDKIALLMNRSDFAIVTPSVTVNEIVHMGIPFISIKTAENQNEMYQYLDQHHYSILEKFDAADLLKKIAVITSNEIELVNFTDLSLNEKKMILEWRNHSSIRQWMFTSECISLQNHLKYIDTLNTRDDRSYFLIKRISQSIGVIDFTNIDHRNKTTEFGLYANPALRGVGNQLMESVIDYAFNTLDIKKLIAEVFEENYAAIKLYKRYDFKTVMTKQINNKNIICMELDNENR